jgi:YVTN family beta-propeller protein
MKNKILFLSLVLFVFSCKKEDEKEESRNPETTYLNGRYVINEGALNQNNASITYISSEGNVVNDVYFNVNGVELGDILQSFTVIGSNGYAVLNNSQKVEVIGLSDFKRIATIASVDYPRYLVDGGNGFGYLSNGSMTGDLKVIDLSSNQIIASIPVGNGPEKMLLHGGQLFVCNSGGWLTDNTVSVVNTTDNSVVDVITVGDRPVDIAADIFGNIWVLCSGETLYDENWNVTGHTNAMLYRINATDLVVTASEQIGVNGDHPLQLEVSPGGTVLYYENNGVYAIDLNTGEFPGAEIISDDRGSLNVDPVSGNIWSASVSDFMNPSNIGQFSPSGAMINSFQAGIGTNGVAFR